MRFFLTSLISIIFIGDIFSQDSINLKKMVSSKLNLKSFGLSVAANYNIFKNEFHIPTLKDAGYQFTTGYNSLNLLLDIKVNTPLGTFRQKWSETSFTGSNGENLNYNFLKKSGFGSYKSMFFQYLPQGVTYGLNKLLGNIKMTPDQAIVTDLILPDLTIENLEGPNLNFKRTEMFGLFGMIGYSNTKFNNINYLNQRIDAQLKKFYIISLTNIARRSWIENILYINTMISKQNGKTYKQFLRSLNDSYRSFVYRLIPIPMLDLYVLNENVQVTDLNNGNVLSRSSQKGLWGYNVGIGWINYIAIPNLRTIIIPSAYYYFIDMAFPGEDSKSTNLIEQKRFNFSIMLQTYF